MMVPPSTYSNSPPKGTPRANRLSFKDSIPFNPSKIKLAVASPSNVELVAKIISENEFSLAFAIN
ncbi:uncharacterized protein METZ01_LOCUS46326 [marine metagenome]|uniref:Uncharacterized protein n=1 Tax=marine metagenome TaxID=408172 RepID=A0A381RNM5_9ZZZZ